MVPDPPPPPPAQPSPTNPNSAASSSSSSASASSSSVRRGAFILLEGVDRCGKTTQCGRLLQHLVGLSVAAVAMRFPDRATSVGTLIDGYLASGTSLDDRAVHLLFSANRWEAAPALAGHLSRGSTVVCDRYAYSGVAFSSAKEGADLSGEGGEPLGLEWCQGPDVGLPAPDCVVFLDLDQDVAETRGGYGGERYEKRDLQVRVRQRFAELRRMDEERGAAGVPWHVVDASRTMDEVTADIVAVVDATMKRVEEGAPLRRMFAEGEYQLPKQT